MGRPPSSQLDNQTCEQFFVAPPRLWQLFPIRNNGERSLALPLSGGLGLGGLYPVPVQSSLGLESLMKVLTFLPRCDLRRRVEKGLGSAQFVVETVVSAKECLEFAQFAQYEAVLVDSDSLIFADALALVKRLRQENSDASLFVFARYLDLEQRLLLFEAGVDDCVGEPFFASELVVRLGLSIRLRQAASDVVASNAVNVLRSGDLELDLVRRTAARLGKAIDLRPKEFLLLEYLVRNVNRPVTRTMILEHVWNSSFEGLTNVVDVYISALRGKVDRDFPQKLIQTNRGSGYTLTCMNGSPPTSETLRPTYPLRTGSRASTTSGIKSLRLRVAT
jgi:two-component system, OmpR family, response regulator